MFPSNFSVLQYATTNWKGKLCLVVFTVFQYQKVKLKGKLLYF